jgi:hypothetical protein
MRFLVRRVELKILTISITLKSLSVSLKLLQIMYLFNIRAKKYCLFIEIFT